MAAKQKILVVDDDSNIAELICLYLVKEGYDTERASNGREALKVMQKSNPNLVILDVMMPEMDGYETCREIRKQGNTPVVFLTAKGETFDKVLGLELGADDYIVKPFDNKELVARVKAVLRRSETKETNTKKLMFPGLIINQSNYSVNYKDKDIEMPPKELELLFFLASHPNQVFTREQLLNQIWGYEYYGDTRTVDVHIKRIREKLDNDEHAEPWSIKTVWGVGYKFEVKDK
ncbi:MAG: response regulator transcription factor [Firmicutes bacterium]|nr:response regulator transcription factor [Bacillota bacterium]